jgi:hypothetical protein
MNDKKAFSLHDLICQGLQEGAQKAHIEHKKNHQPIIICKNGKIIEVPPEEIDIPSNEP